MPKSDCLVDRMKHLLSAGNDAADVHFLLLPAHKLILTAASDVFEAMFRFDAQNAKAAGGASLSKDIKPVEMPDVEVGAFKAMLSFIYADDPTGISGDNLFAVLYAANKYDVSGLVKACVNFPKEKLRNGARDLIDNKLTRRLGSAELLPENATPENATPKMRHQKMRHRKCDTGKCDTKVENATPEYATVENATPEYATVENATPEYATVENATPEYATVDWVKACLERCLPNCLEIPLFERFLLVERYRLDNHLFLRDLNVENLRVFFKTNRARFCACISSKEFQDALITCICDKH
uniref:BTB domain-containing protein n=1 Tax=Globodera rostochiensis TaxID=31243 RepID=A0A914IF97_GLORO